MLSGIVGFVQQVCGQPSSGSRSAASARSPWRPCDVVVTTTTAAAAAAAAAATTTTTTTTTTSTTTTTTTISEHRGRQTELHNKSLPRLFGHGAQLAKACCYASHNVSKADLGDAPINIYIYIYTHVVDISQYIYICVCVCTYVYVCIYIYTDTYIHTYIHTDRQTDRQTDRLRQTDLDRQT